MVKRLPVLLQLGKTGINMEAVTTLREDLDDDERREIEDVDATLGSLYDLARYTDMDAAAETLNLRTNIGRGALQNRMGWKEIQLKEVEAALARANMAICSGYEPAHGLLATCYAIKGMDAELSEELKRYEIEDLFGINTILIALIGLQKKGKCIATLADIRKFSNKISGNTKLAAHCHSNYGWLATLLSEFIGEMEDVEEAVIHLKKARDIYEEIKAGINFLASVKYRISYACAKFNVWESYIYALAAVDDWTEAARLNSGLSGSLEFNKAWLAKVIESSRSLGVALPIKEEAMC